MPQNPYIRDILSQSLALREALAGFDDAPLRALHQDLQAGRFDRIVLTGMGSSTYGTYPAWLELVRYNLPAWTIETGELIHYADSLITPRTLLWITSQSGRTAEVVTLLDRARCSHPAFILTMTNETNSPLGREGNAVLLLRAGEEATVSTKTYLNTLALAQLAGQALCGEPLDQALDELDQVATGMQDFLHDFDARVSEVEQAAGQIERLFLLGRGASMANVETGSLTLKESTKFPAVGLSAGQFRHGPLELVDPRLTVLIFAGHPATLDLNRRLGAEIVRRGGHVLWVGAQPAEGSCPLPMPSTAGAGLLLAEMMPVQALSIVLAGQNSIEPGIFRHITKVTNSE